jgi:hypothetical protein
MEASYLQKDYGNAIRIARHLVDNVCDDGVKVLLARYYAASGDAKSGLKILSDLHMGGRFASALPGNDGAVMPEIERILLTVFFKKTYPVGGLLDHDFKDGSHYRALPGDDFFGSFSAKPAPHFIGFFAKPTNIDHQKMTVSVAYRKISSDGEARAGNAEIDMSRWRDFGVRISHNEINSDDLPQSEKWALSEIYARAVLAALARKCRNRGERHLDCAAQDDVESLSSAYAWSHSAESFIERKGDGPYGVTSGLLKRLLDSARRNHPP